MDKEFLIERIDKDMSINQIAKEVGKSPNTVTYWLNKFKLKTNHLSFKDKGLIDYGGERCCPRCDETKLTTEFYKRRGKEGASVYCKKCTGEQALERQRNLKQMAINYKGGSCQECGYHKYNGALEFHHIDPNEKDFHLSALKSYAFSDKVKTELDKCVLLCANCHREVHGGLIII